MSGVLGKCLSNTPNIQLLEEEQAAKSIVVSNISPQTTKEGVTIHFQRQKNGGGEIDALHIPKEGTAVITFEKSEGLCILVLSSCYLHETVNVSDV